MTVEKSCPAGGHISETRQRSRAEIMRTEFGPLLHHELKAIYRPYFTDEFVLSTRADLDMGSIKRFTVAVITELLERVRKTPAEDRIQYALGQHRDGNDGKKLTYFDNASAVIQEGIETGVTASLRLALDIMSVESDEPERGLSERLLSVMERESFKDILLTLTVGPNGYLGEQANRIDVIAANKLFFAFRDPEKAHVSRHEAKLKWGLGKKQAFSYKDGYVVGLSGLFRIASQDQRKYLAHTAEGPDASSDGCPVRRQRKLPDGSLEDSLVEMSRNFLVTLLRECCREDRISIK